MEQEKKYGDSVAYIKAAHEKSIQLMKLSSSFAKKYAAYATPSIPIKTPLSASLLQICTLLQSQITPLHVKMLKENEIIYHEPIPACMTIEKLSLSNPTDFKTICQPLDPRHIIGSDLFHSLVPMDVHINASVYSDKLSNFTRQIQLECEVSDDLFKATLDSMDVYKVITSIKTSTQTFEFDGAVCAMIENLKRSESSSDSIGESEEKIGSMKNTVQSSFTRIQELILKIKREGSAFALITGNPIETLLLNKMESDFERYEKVYNEGQTTDKSRIESNLGLKRGITLLLEPLKNLERIVESAGQSSDVSLIDIESGISMTEDVLLSKVESLISKLRECKSHRSILLERLKTKVLLTSQ